ncbi:TRAFAC class myosin-kinesin ATPase super [Blomia tropicalis]|nr:TRAFAC class myosin-kinesin ATPase super [Blomia tropicalis]
MNKRKNNKRNDVVRSTNNKNNDNKKKPSKSTNTITNKANNKGKTKIVKNKVKTEKRQTIKQKINNVINSKKKNVNKSVNTTTDTNRKNNNSERKNVKESNARNKRSSPNDSEKNRQIAQQSKSIVDTQNNSITKGKIKKNNVSIQVNSKKSNLAATTSNTSTTARKLKKNNVVKKVEIRQTRNSPKKAEKVILNNVKIKEEIGIKCKDVKSSPKPSTSSSNNNKGHSNKNVKSENQDNTKSVQSKQINAKRKVAAKRKRKLSSSTKAILNTKLGSRVASLNASAKVKLLFESDRDSSSSWNNVHSHVSADKNATSNHNQQGSSSANVSKQKKHQSDDHTIPSSVSKSSSSKNETVSKKLTSTKSQNTKTKIPHKLSGPNSNSSIPKSKDNKLKKSLPITKRKKKKRTKRKNIRSLVDSDVEIIDTKKCKRMASLNASAILAASYMPETRIVPKSSSIESDEPIFVGSSQPNDGSTISDTIDQVVRQWKSTVEHRFENSMNNDQNCKTTVMTTVKHVKLRGNGAMVETISTHEYEQNIVPQSVSNDTNHSIVNINNNHQRSTNKKQRKQVLLNRMSMPQPRRSNSPSAFSPCPSTSSYMDSNSLDSIVLIPSQSNDLSPISTNHRGHNSEMSTIATSTHHHLHNATSQNNRNKRKDRQASGHSNNSRSVIQKYELKTIETRVESSTNPSSGHNGHNILPNGIFANNNSSSLINLENAAFPTNPYGLIGSRAVNHVSPLFGLSYINQNGTHGLYQTPSPQPQQQQPSSVISVLTPNNTGSSGCPLVRPVPYHAQPGSSYLSTSNSANNLINGALFASPSQIFSNLPPQTSNIFHCSTTIRPHPIATLRPINLTVPPIPCTQPTVLISTNGKVNSTPTNTSLNSTQIVQSKPCSTIIELSSLDDCTNSKTKCSNSRTVSDVQGDDSNYNCHIQQLTNMTNNIALNNDNSLDSVHKEYPTKVNSNNCVSRKQISQISTPPIDNGKSIERRLENGNKTKKQGRSIMARSTMMQNGGLDRSNMKNGFRKTNKNLVRQQFNNNNSSFLLSKDNETVSSDDQTTINHIEKESSSPPEVIPVSRPESSIFNNARLLAISSTVTSNGSKKNNRRLITHGWTWEGEQYNRYIFMNNDDPPIMRRCYPAIKHEEGEIIHVRDCVLLKSGPRKTDLPFVAKITALWESPENEMMMSLLWYYRPEHTPASEGCLVSELYASKHRDVNSVACIDDKCYVLTYNEYCRYRRNKVRLQQNLSVKCDKSIMTVPACPTDMPYLRRDRIPAANILPELVFCCRKILIDKQTKQPSYTDGSKTKEQKAKMVYLIDGIVGVITFER